VPNYSATLTEFREELKRLLAEQDRIQKQIGLILKAMESIQVLARDSDEPIVQPLPPDEEAGFTDRVRAILKANPLRPLTAVEIRDVILASESGADPKVMLIHTHNTLKRLHRQQEVEEGDTVDGRKAYKLKYAFDALAALSGLKLDPPPDGWMDAFSALGGKEKK
jgi:hypothetical protein